MGLVLLSLSTKGKDGRGKGSSAERCKDGRATNVVRGRDSSKQKCTGGELPKPYESRGLLREQLCPGE